MQQNFIILLLLVWFSAQVTPKSLDDDHDDGCAKLEKKTFELDTKIAKVELEVCGLEVKMKEKGETFQNLLGTMKMNMTNMMELVTEHTAVQTALRADIDNLIQRLDTQLSTPAPTDHYECPENWLQHNGQCFLFSTDQIGWIRAKVRCQSYDAHLAIVDTEELNTFMKIRLRSPDGNSHYVGGIDFGQQDWLWDFTNNELGYTDWKPNQPSNGRNEHCMIICSGPTCQWNDVDCEFNSKYICQRDAVRN